MSKSWGPVQTPVALADGDDCAESGNSPVGGWGVDARTMARASKVEARAMVRVVQIRSARALASSAVLIFTE